MVKPLVKRPHSSKRKAAAAPEAVDSSDNDEGDADEGKMEEDEGNDGKDDEDEGKSLLQQILWTICHPLRLYLFSDKLCL